MCIMVFQEVGRQIHVGLRLRRGLLKAQRSQLTSQRNIESVSHRMGFRPSLLWGRLLVSFVPTIPAQAAPRLKRRAQRTVIKII